MSEALGLGPGQGTAVLLAVLLPAIAVPLARRLPVASAVSRAPLAERWAAALLLAAAGVHLGLVSVHRGTGLAFWMLVDGVAFLAVAVAVFRLRWWRWPAAALLLLTLLAYLSVTGSGREPPDQLGMATAMVEPLPVVPSDSEPVVPEAEIAP